jgi:PhzF family phenazine biosynthesis protein
MENNLSETAFIVKNQDNYGLRWFTPQCEVELCGHATLAAAHLILYHFKSKRNEVTFFSKSGKLNVNKENDLLSINLPAIQSKKAEPSEIITEALGKKPSELYESEDIMAVFDTEEDIKSITPDFIRMKKIETRGFIVTAPGKNADFVSRFFAPAVGIDEDPVTGSAHTKLVPYWSARTGKNELRALQLSK